VNRTIFDLLHENATADLDLLLNCDARGDDFAKARTVDFGFKVKDRERRPMTFANTLMARTSGRPM